jgi:hypothetical protein
VASTTSVCPRRPHSHPLLLLPASLCRERQRATIGSLEVQLSQRLGQLQLLTEEQQKLRLRAAVLEATVCSREYHVSAAACMLSSA